LTFANDAHRFYPPLDRGVGSLEVLESNHMIYYIYNIPMNLFDDIDQYLDD